jgi:hypothetical protein
MRRAFTLLEILASLLLAVMGVAAVIGMMRYATRLGVTAQLRMTAVAAAETVLYDPLPGGRTADAGDADKDGWYGSGALAVTAAAAYDFSVYGWLDGYYVVRQESSSAADLIDDASRWSTVTVHVYAGQEDEHLTSIRRRVLRRIPRGP